MDQLTCDMNHLSFLNDEHSRFTVETSQKELSFKEYMDKQKQVFYADYIVNTCMKVDNPDAVTDEDRVLCFFINICKFDDNREVSSLPYELYNAIMNNNYSTELKILIDSVFNNVHEYMYDYYEEKIGFIHY